MNLKPCPLCGQVPAKLIFTTLCGCCADNGDDEWSFVGDCCEQFTVMVVRPPRYEADPRTNGEAEEAWNAAPRGKEEE